MIQAASKNLFHQGNAVCKRVVWINTRLLIHPFSRLFRIVSGTFFHPISSEIGDWDVWSYHEPPSQYFSLLRLNFNKLAKANITSPQRSLFHINAQVSAHYFLLIVANIDLLAGSSSRVDSMAPQYSDPPVLGDADPSGDDHPLFIWSCMVRALGTTLIIISSAKAKETKNTYFSTTSIGRASLDLANLYTCSVVSDLVLEYDPSTTNSLPRSKRNLDCIECNTWIWKRELRTKRINTYDRSPHSFRRWCCNAGRLPLTQGRGTCNNFQAAFPSQIAKFLSKGAFSLFFSYPPSSFQ